MVSSDLFTSFATFQCRRDYSQVSTGVYWTLCHLQGSNPVVLFTEVQYVENPGCDQYGIKKKAVREQMKFSTCICTYFLHFALTFKFRKYVFTQETFKFLCQSQYSHCSFLTLQLYCWESWFFLKIKYLILLSVYLKCIMLWK